jgi:acyl-coenzyme A thioesterase PaaI-like protein
MGQAGAPGGLGTGASAPAGTHFVGYLGLEIWHKDGNALARMPITPQMWSGARKRPMVGLLFTMADMVAGSPPWGPVGPTIELRMRLLTPPPSQGSVLARARPLKAGKRLFSGEVVMSEEGSSHQFGVAEFTFLNQAVPEATGDTYASRRLGHQAPRLPFTSFSDLFAIRFAAPGEVEMDRHDGVRNGPQGTIQGGAQAALAEAAAESALSGCYGGADFEVVDIHMRYLNPVTAGPAVARAEVLGGEGDHLVVRVAITDSGAGSRLVSSALVVCTRTP